MEKRKHYEGLNDQQVVESRAKYGVNLLTPPKKDSLWKQFLEKFSDPLIVILIIAGILSIGIACYEYFGLGEGLTVFFEPAGIFVAILLATGLAFYFELKANKAFNLLNKVNNDEPVKVIRNSNVTVVPKVPKRSATGSPTLRSVPLTTCANWRSRRRLWSCSRRGTSPRSCRPT